VGVGVVAGRSVFVGKGLSPVAGAVIVLALFRHALPLPRGDAIDPG
jgi:hypothetical protein